MKLLSTTAAIVLLSAGLSFAAIDNNALVGTLQSQGYTRIEVKNGPTQTKVEAIRGTEKVEVVYDNATGEVLKREVETVRPGEDIAPGVSIRARDRDFLDGSSDDSDDDLDDDLDDDSDDDSDDNSDDDSADDNDSDDSDDSGGQGRGRGRGGNDDGNESEGDDD